MCGEQRLTPLLNRCATSRPASAASTRVEEVRCPPGMVRQLVRRLLLHGGAPAQGLPRRGSHHHFRARPDESLKRLVLMPAEKALKQVKAQGDRARRVKERLSRLVSR